ncbi:MAG: MBL fold metallo-hydrolase [Isosphaeraceae bacterium]
MSALRFVCLGTGDAFSARWYSSSLAIEADGAWLLFDCPHPIRKILREAGESAGVPLDIDRFAAVALSHLHADHASGLEGWAFYSRFLLNRRAVVLTHPEVAEALWGHLSASMGSILSGPGGQRIACERDDYFDIHLLDETAPVSFGPFSIECRRTLHHIPTFAMRIHAAGRCLALSADTSFDPGLIDWLSSADLIVHETNVGIHTPYEHLAALPADLRQKMRLTHYPDDFDTSGSVIEPLEQGRLYTV